MGRKSCSSHHTVTVETNGKHRDNGNVKEGKGADGSVIYIMIALIHKLCMELHDLGTNSTYYIFNHKVRSENNRMLQKITRSQLYPQSYAVHYSSLQFSSVQFSSVLFYSVLYLVLSVRAQQGECFPPLGEVAHSHQVHHLVLYNSVQDQQEWVALPSPLKERALCGFP